ncbi:MAG: glycosyltransferase family 2 protein [Clostridiales bacterium]|nr:glycosyltransferase family 2 protein [Clostridiales bacterium]
MGKRITLIVPCYNEEEALPIFYRVAVETMDSLTDYEFDFLLINDGSRDGTLSVMKELAERDPRVRYLSFSRNFGKEAAMFAGFVNAQGDYVAVMDADLQDPPTLLPEMIAALETGEYDSVATRRVTREGEPPIRSFFARMFYRIINRISDADVVDGARDFRLMRREMVQAIVSMCEYNRFSKGIFGWVGFRTKWLPYKNVERAAGQTKWNFFSLFRYSIDGIINFSQAPLAIASYMGLFFTLISFIMVMFVMIRRLIFGDPVAGWASTVCIILFIGGVQLLCMGIMGQYLSKTYMEVKHRPHYIVSETNDEQAIRIR